MSTFNFASLQEKANQVLHNADEAISKWIDLTLAPAKDVPIEYYDKNGNLVQTTVPNRAKLFNDLLVNVNSAMEKEFYVDAINGNDDNDGSATAPFKTPEKAIASVPVGGTAKIYLCKDQVHKITSHIPVINKHIIFLPKPGPGTNKPKILHKSYTTVYGSTTYYSSYFMHLYNSSLIFINIDIEVEAKADPSIPSASNHVAIRNVLNSSVRCVLCNIYIHGLAFFSTRDNTFGALSVVQCNIVDEGYVVDTNLSTCSLNNYGSTTQNNRWVLNMVKDSNNIPRNVISNLIL